MKNSNFDNLEFSGVGHRLILSDLYYVIDDYCKGFENLVASLPSYKPSDIIDIDIPNKFIKEFIV